MGGTGQEIRRIYTRGGPKNCPRTGQVCYYDCYTHRRDNAKVSQVLVRREKKISFMLSRIFLFVGTFPFKRERENSYSEKMCPSRMEWIGREEKKNIIAVSGNPIR